MSKSPAKTPGFVTNATTAAQILGISRRQFDRLQKAGVIPASAPRRFDLQTVVPAFVRYVEMGREGSTTLAEAKFHTERARAKKLELENATSVRALVKIDAVGAMLAEVAAAAVGELESIPSRYGPELAPVTDPAEMRHRLHRIVREFRGSYAAKLQDMFEQLENGQ